MARTDTLAHFLTDVASAIKTKKGSQTAIQASNFDTEIANLPSGGGIETATVTFVIDNSEGIAEGFNEFELSWIENGEYWDKDLYPQSFTFTNTVYKNRTYSVNAYLYGTDPETGDPLIGYAYAYNVPVNGDTTINVEIMQWDPEGQGYEEP